MSNDSANRTKHLISHLCALIVAGVFLYAAFEKIGHDHVRQFVIAIKNYHMVPDSALNLMAIFLPWWEVGAAIAIIAPQTRRAGAILIMAMLMMFIIAVSYAAFYKGYNIDCGCFGKNSSQAGWKTVGFDLSLFIAALLSVILYCREKTVADKAGAESASHPPAH